MNNELIYNKQHEPDLSQLLDVRDPIDKLILELAENGELKVGTVVVKNEKWYFLKQYINNLLFYIGMHYF